jgi:hypothetical protein
MIETPDIVDKLADAFATLTSCDLSVEFVYVNPADAHLFDTLVPRGYQKEGPWYIQIDGVAEMVMNLHGHIWGAFVILEDSIPKGLVFLESDPDKETGGRDFAFQKLY